jgi:5'(3')-deoxyribonucleotidase
MFDDYYDNAVSFSGYAYLLTKPHNLKYRWYRRVNNWDEFIKKMEDNHERGM